MRINQLHIMPVIAVFLFRNKGIQYIREAIKGVERDIVWLKMEPVTEMLRYDVRFHDMVEKYFRYYRAQRNFL